MLPVFRLATLRVLDGWWQPLLLLLLPVLLFLPALLHGTPPFGGDVVVLNYPLLTLLKQQLEQGQLPLWNTYSGGGYPLAPFSALIFYPPLWGLRFLSVDTAITVLDIVHFALAGLGAYALASITGASRISRLIGALSFLLSGYLVSHLFAGHLFETGVIAWMPWVFFAAHRLIGKPSVHAALLLGLAGALQVLANGLGFLIFTLYPVLIVLAIGLFTRYKLHWLAGVQLLGLLLLSAVVTLGLSSVLLLPFAQILGHSVRSGGLDFTGASAISLPPAGLLMLFSPDAVGNGPQNSYWLNDFSNGYWHEFALYVGLVPFLGALLAPCRQWRRAWVPLYVVLVLAGLLLALGRYTPVYGLAFNHLPLLNLVRVPSRWLLVSTLGTAVLAPVGVDWLLEQRSGVFALWQALKAPLLILLLLVLAILIGLQVIYMRGGNLDIQPRFSQTLQSALGRFVLFSCLLALILACRADRLIRPSFTATLLVSLTLLDLWTAASGSVRFLDPGQFYQPSTVSDLLRSSSSTYRVLTIDRSMPNRQGMVSGTIYDAEDFAPVTISAYFSISHRWNVKGATEVSKANARDLFNCYDPEADSLLGISEITLSSPNPSKALCPSFAGTPNLIFRSAVATEYWLLPNGTNWNPTPFLGVTYVYRNPTALPRTFLMPPSSVLTIDKDLDQRQAVLQSSFNGRRDLVLGPQRSVVPLGLDWLQDLWASFLRPTQAPLPVLQAGETRVLLDRSDSIQIAVRAAAPSYLVLDDSYYPGWQAYLDGKPVSILQADYLLRAVQVPAGTHLLTFVYAPLSYLVGIAITATTTLVLVVALLWPLVRRIRRRQLPSRIQEAG